MTAANIDQLVRELQQYRQENFGPDPRACIITGIALRRTGEHAVVEVETEIGWTEVIRERADGAFSHIVEPTGIHVAMKGR